VIELALVVIGGGDRLELELDVVEAGQREGLAQARDREVLQSRGARPKRGPVREFRFRDRPWRGIGPGVADEAHGAPHHGGRAEGTELRLGARADAPEDEADEIAQRVVAGHDPRGGEALAGEERLQGLHQPALAVALQVGVDRRLAGEARGMPVPVQLVAVEVEDGPEGREQLGPVRVPGEGHGPGGVGHGERAVGGTEVETNVARHALQSSPSAGWLGSCLLR
jgi:hypothetical protein